MSEIDAVIERPETTIDGIEYGPLAALIGVWKGDQGVDIAPEPDGTENNPYFETITFEPAKDVENAEEQELVAVRYHQQVTRTSTGKVFHDQVGYWMWDARTRTLMHSFTIPRAVAIVSGAVLTEDQANNPTPLLKVTAGVDPDWPIAQSPFMAQKAKTLSYECKIKVNGDKMSYAQTTMLDIYGREFEHTDKNALVRVGD
ncbi:Uncharacterised protein [BD1-7 clade bacterium]|uniref:THAP4-like heme-binding domain-containing protein n=1 Tax=BD1-7 clade bacterium TaxID=2029982 RepID=A0A5S9PIK3_9GAMM|nr:Uncharacterised protein [BD1-7 clade bacterium]CAA0103656.1 Uncharacterised protein [BD1-7 clade bacterium]